jgi:nitrate/TMAO reductase-like tetraheme cytochrome c subunit
MTPQQVAVGRPPLPGGVAAVLRFFFNLPQWFQIAGFVAGVLVALAVLWLAWRSRAAIIAWLVSRPKSTKLALAAVVGVVALVAAGGGAIGFHYIEHDNGFCTGCHVMNEPFQRFAGSKHDSLECHNCHQQSMVASMRQLYLWVAERPEKIGKHAKVPTRVCSNCHVQGNAKETWQRIASTAGHRIHLQSDSSALKGVQCVTCHGLEVHRFVPVNATCAQAGCHVTVQIRLAKMRDQTELHCVVCHRFTADVPALATYDSARGTLVPGMKQCLSCHEMQAVLAEFDPAHDPHRGTCGGCHNPHTQASPTEAARTCTSAKCHADWRSDPFHIGTNHRAVNEDCTLCHEPHHAKVDPSDCAGCHAAVKQRRAGKRLSPPLPFDTVKALQRVSDLTPVPPLRIAERGSGGEDSGHGPFFDGPPPGGDPRGGEAAADSFPHDRHKRFACITCHASQREHGRLTFAAPRGCQICHHQAPQTSDCTTCHPATALARPESVAVRLAVAGAEPQLHPARFEHDRHRALKCVACHTTPATLEPQPAIARCAACHDDHHGPDRPCVACHSEGGSAAVRAAHAPPVEAHTACDACHPSAIVARLVPDRALCLTCHAAQREHHADRECTVCHFGASPEAFQDRLHGAAGS